MPYKSEARRRWFHENAEKLKKQGIDVKEWDKESKGLKLPDRVGPVQKKKVAERHTKPKH